MNTFFEVKVKYEKINEQGQLKVVSELYLIDAVSNGDAEAKAHEQLEPFISGEFDVKATKQANYSELIKSDEGDKYFKCKVSFIAMDEEKGKEKKTNVYMLVQAGNVKDAYFNIESSLADSMSSFEIPAIQESKIIDVFEYDNSESTD
jgi:hypothetical protein